MRPKSRAFDFALADWRRNSTEWSRVASWSRPASGDRAFKRLVAHGYLHRVHRGVYAVGHRRLTKNGRVHGRRPRVWPNGGSQPQMRRGPVGAEERRKPHGGQRPRRQPPGSEGHPPSPAQRHPAPRPRHHRCNSRHESGSHARRPRGRRDTDRLGRAWEEADRLRKLDVRAVEEVLARATAAKAPSTSAPSLQSAASPRTRARAWSASSPTSSERRGCRPPRTTH